MKYDAFISYRHADLDMEIAKKVHTGLETYHVPRAARKKLEKKKIKRVFRDQEELPIGSDLNDNISSALKESEYLIVICSPRTPESYWVCKEIESFIEMHDRDHILAVLIEGEPNESFPPLLLTDEKGNPVEPLAADVRGETAKERNKKFKTEILRLAAPVLGCSYDDLKQRHRERIIRRTITFVSTGAAIVAVAGAAFGIYNANVAAKMKQLADEKAQLADEKSQLADEKTQLAEEILEEYTDKQRNQSRFYAEKSLSLFADGNRLDAALVAMAGLPSEENDRPYVGNAEYALSKALYAYETEGDWGYDRVLSHDMKVKDTKVTRDKKLLIVTDVGQNVYVWDVETWTLKCKIEAKLGANNRTIYVNEVHADESGVYIGTSYGITKYSYDGEVIFEYAGKGEQEGKMIVDLCKFSPEKKTAAVISPKVKETDNIVDSILALTSEKEYVINILNLETGEVIKSFDNPLDIEFGIEMSYSYDGNSVAVSHGDDYTDNPLAYITVFNIETGEVSSLEMSGKRVQEIYPVETGGFVILSSDALRSINEDQNLKVEFISGDGSQVLWTTPLEVNGIYSWNYNSLIRSHTYKENDKTILDIVFAKGPIVYTLDGLSGEIKAETTLPDGAYALLLYVDRPTGMVGLGNGQLLSMDFSTGEFDNDSFNTGKRISEITGFGQYLALRSYLSSDIYILTPHYARDLTTIYEGDKPITVVGVSKESDYICAKDWDNDEYLFFSSSGTKLLSYNEMEYLLPDAEGECDGYHLFLDNTVIHKVNPVSGDTVSYDFSVLKDYMDQKNGSFTRNGKYLASWGYGYILVIDTETNECLYFNDSDDIKQLEIGNVVVSEDGKSLYVSATDTNLFRVDMASGEIRYYENDLLREISDTYQSQYLKVSPDGKYLAMCCFDGKVRVIEEASGDTIDEFELPAMYNTYIEFTGGSDYLIAQDDDYTIKIRDIKNKEHISSYGEMTGGITYIVEDEENGILAISSGYLTALFETSQYAVVADCRSSYGVTYCKNDKTFLLSGYSNLFTIGYKDYKKLCEEAREQFGDAELTEEKKILYNID